MFHNSKTKGHGSIRKNKVYGTIGILTLGTIAILSAHQGVAADEVKATKPTTPAPVAEASDTSLAAQSKAAATEAASSSTAAITTAKAETTAPAGATSTADTTTAPAATTTESATKPTATTTAETPVAPKSPAQASTTDVNVDSSELDKAVNDAKKAGISNISLDVMLGTPKQTLSSLDETFEFIDKMNVTHISAYMLKIEKGTRFFDLKDRLALPDEDTVCEMYLKTIKSLEALGFNQYEISNFSKPSFESKHNTKYWILDDYLGLGKSAHSLWHGKRFYYDTDWSLKGEGEVDIEEERIMLGLRLNCGIDKSLIKKDFSRFVKMGLMKESENKIALTSEGMLVSNLIISELL